MQYEVIIVGGSYSGLSAGLALARALKQVLIIDSGKPCNRQTPHSHNFITQDGKTPNEILELAKNQVERYNTVNIVQGLVTNGIKTNCGFDVHTESGDIFNSSKLIFATGIKDIMPDIEGFAECWGISILHCPYCHGYEVRDKNTGILGNGIYGFEFSKLIANWTNKLTLFTNGKSTLKTEQTVILKSHNIQIDETEIDKFEHKKGYLQNIIFKDNTKIPISVLYSSIPFVQHCKVPEILGCEMTEDGYIKTDQTQKTSISGIYACGDNVTRMRTVSNAVAMGTIAGMMLNKELIEEYFQN